MEQNNNNLNTLGILYYVWGGLSIMSFVISWIIFIFGMGLISHIYPELNEILVVGGIIFYIIMIFSVVIQLAAGILCILCGTYLRQNRNRTFCMVIAAIICLSFPLGTILGVFTLIELSKTPKKSVQGF